MIGVEQSAWWEWEGLGPTEELLLVLRVTGAGADFEQRRGRKTPLEPASTRPDCSSLQGLSGRGWAVHLGIDPDLVMDPLGSRPLGIPREVSHEVAGGRGQGPSQKQRRIGGPGKAGHLNHCVIRSVGPLVAVA